MLNTELVTIFFGFVFQPSETSSANYPSSRPSQSENNLLVDIHPVSALEGSFLFICVWHRWLSGKAPLVVDDNHPTVE